MSFGNGYLVFVEGDNNDWWNALSWQKEEFIKFMAFGTMKTMSIPNEITYSNTFKKNGFTYRFIVINDWGPVYLENINTKKQREFKYVELKRNNDFNHLLKK